MSNYEATYSNQLPIYPIQLLDLICNCIADGSPFEDVAFPQFWIEVMAQTTKGWALNETKWLLTCMDE